MRAELLALLRGEKTLNELGTGPFSILSIRGTAANPIFQVDARRVSQPEFERHRALLPPQTLAIDWGDENALHLNIYAPPATPGEWRNRQRT